jgi:hypothetical protein
VEELLMRSFCQGVAVYPQPSPNRNAGGDCFACALTAALRHFYKESAPTFDQVWACFQEELTRGDTGEKWMHLCNTWTGYRTAFYAAADIVGRMEIFTDFVAPEADHERYSCDWGIHLDGYAWAKRLDAWLCAGHLAFASIYYAGNPTGEWVQTPDGPRRHSTDHFVLLDGVRDGWRKHPTVDGAASLVYQVHVVCSAAGGRTYWIDVATFLREHGAGAWWLIRPEERGDLPVGA